MFWFLLSVPKDNNETGSETPKILLKFVNESTYRDDFVQNLKLKIYRTIKYTLMREKESMKAKEKIQRQLQNSLCPLR